MSSGPHRSALPHRTNSKPFPDPCPSPWRPHARLTAHDFAPEVLKLFDQYVHGQISRRGFLDGAARYTTAGTTAAGLLAALSPRFAAAQQVAPQDPRIRTSRVEIASPQGYGSVKAYLAQPAQAAGRLPTVLVVHENRGLNPHIEDIARRLAVDGFIALRAPDALASARRLSWRRGRGARRCSRSSNRQKVTREDFLAAMARVAVIDVRPSNGKLGATGFCWGGGMTNFLATQVERPRWRRALLRQPSRRNWAMWPSIKAADAGGATAADDERINAGWPAYEAALKAGRRVVRGLIYPAGVQHGFNNDTTPRYDEAAARLAWQRTVAFFKRTLAG